MTISKRRRKISKRGAERSALFLHYNNLKLVKFKVIV